MRHGAWDQKEMRDHREAGARLTAIMHDTFAYLSAHPRTTESATKDFILAALQAKNMVMDKPFATPIVAFGDHSTDPHYTPVPGTRRLAPGMLVMIDMWARIRGRHMPYADITWMGYCATARRRGAAGSRTKVPRDMQKAFDAVIAARDACLAFIAAGARHDGRRGQLPTGRDANAAANAVLIRRGYRKNILHSTGHTLGFVSPHGRGRHLSRRNKCALLKNLGYTDEPGVYIKNKFGVRSEMNFYVDVRGKIVVTTPLQKKLVRI